MTFVELILPLGFFVISLAVIVYLVRYSNQRLGECLRGLEEKHNELVDLNSRLARTILRSDKDLKDQLTNIASLHVKVDPKQKIRAN